MIQKKSIFIIAVLLALAVIASGAILSSLNRKPQSTEKEPSVKIAIVIDDLGYNTNNLELICDIKIPLTISILPNLLYSRQIALDVDRCGHEVILHLPLEPYKKDAPLEANTICLDMPEDVVREKLDISIKSIPTAKGISNHMGSRVTENEEMISLIFRELERRKLYFLDSLVTDKSVCKRIANRTKTGFAKRDIYLDNKNEDAYIRNQLQFLVEKAKREGSSIGIGHDGDLTIKILSEEMPRLKDEGVEFVFVSELIEK